MATAAAETLDSTGKFIFDDATGCTSFLVRCKSGSVASALVNVEGLHADGEWFEIEAGQEYVFRSGRLGIRKIFAKGDSGNADVIYGIVAKT
jgi:hypothetical protein